MTKVLLLMALLTVPLVAQEDPDIQFRATVQAREMKFEKVPNVKVHFHGAPERETVWSTVETNLPEDVQPGVTYKNIGIKLVIESTFERLGEVLRQEPSP